MNNKIIIINGPNLNLLGEREQSQYGSLTLEKLKEKCLNESKRLDLNFLLAIINLSFNNLNHLQ